MSLLEALGSAQSSGRQTRGRVPIFRVQLAGVPLEVTVLEAVLNLGENLHDTGMLKVTASELTTTDGILDSPISFLFGMSPRTEVFCGYVTAVSETDQDTGVLTFTMEVTGPTKTLQTGHPRFWTNRTVPSAVETLSYISYLGYSGHAHDYIWPALAQTEDSDWKAAVSLARRLGWSIYNRYGVVLLQDPLQLIQNLGSSATLISETYTMAKNNPDDERTLVEFVPVEEAENSSEQQGYKVAYFSGDGVQVAMQQGDHSSYSFLTDFVIRGATEASLYVNSKDSDSSVWRQKATARIMGNATLYPGMTVDVMTTNRQYYTGKFNGRWLIRGVQHKMDRQTFQSNLILARPESKTPVYTGGYVPFWQTGTKTRPTLTLNPVSSDPLYQHQSIAGGDVAGGSLDGTKKLLPSGGLTQQMIKTGVWVSSWTNPTVQSVMLQ